MARFDHLKGVFGLLPTPYAEDFELHIPDLRAEADFCCKSGQHGIVWPVMVGEFQYVGEDERIRGWDAVMDEVNGRLPVVFGCSGISVPQVLLYRARGAEGQRRRGDRHDARGHGPGHRHGPVPAHGGQLRRAHHRAERKYVRALER